MWPYCPHITPAQNIGNILSPIRWRGETKLRGYPVMLKRRVIISLCFEDGVLMRTKRFVADYRYTQAYLAIEAVDEVFLIDISRGGPSGASREAMRGYAERCFAPVTMGGWVSSVADAREMFALGADKVVIGRSVLDNPGLIGGLARKFGSQAVTVAVDVADGLVSQPVSRGNPHNFRVEARQPPLFAREAENLGAGEVFFQSIDRDGSLLGYDIATLAEIASKVTIPVVVGGGCGGFRHMIDGFRAGASGCATSVIHHFTESALQGFKREILAAGIPVRAAA